MLGHKVHEHTSTSKLSSKQSVKRLRMYPLDFDWSVLIFSFLCSLFLCLSLSLLPLWYLCIGSCPGDRTHKHCGGRQEVLWNHNGVTAALRSLSSPPLLSLPLSASASMHAIILSRAIHRDHTFSFSPVSLISLIIISIAFSAVSRSPFNFIPH